MADASLPGAIILKRHSYLTFLLTTVAICLLLPAMITCAGAAAPATVAFSSGTYEANGAVGNSLDIPIVRQGDTSGDAYVYLNVSGGTAEYPGDYVIDVPLSTPVHFAPGVADYTVRLTPSGNISQEGDKTVILRLVSPSGADLGGTSIALVTIRYGGEVASPTVTPAPSATASPAPTASISPGTPMPATVTPTLVPLPSSNSQAPFPGAILTIMAVAAGCILLLLRRQK